MHKTIKTILNGETPQITGDGTQTRDFNYVTDVVDAAILAGERGKLGEVYNICSGKETSINDIVGTVESGWTGVVFTGTERDYQEWLNLKYNGSNRKTLVVI